MSKLPILLILLLFLGSTFAFGNNLTILNNTPTIYNTTVYQLGTASLDFYLSPASQYAYNYSFSGLTSTSDFSVSVWYRRDTNLTLGQDQRIFQLNQTGSTTITLAYGNDSAGPRFRIDSGSSAQTFKYNTTAGTWYHLVYIHQEASHNGTLYINNAPVWNLTAQDTESLSNAFYIGGSPFGGSKIQAKIDDFRFYNYSISSVNVSTLYNSSAGTISSLGKTEIAWYPFDSNLIDNSSGPSVPVVLAIYFNGSTPANNTVQNTNSFTVNISATANVSSCLLFLSTNGTSVNGTWDFNGSGNLWSNIFHLNITGGWFNYNASIGVNGYSSFNMQNRMSVSTGYYTTCYLLTNGNGNCYGYYGNINYTGGDAIATYSGNDMCFLRTNGNVLCFGDSALNYTGGDAISGAIDHGTGCYLNAAGNSHCVGDNTYGQATNYTGGNAIAAAAGIYNTCYLLSTGNSICYGSNNMNQSINYTGGDAIAIGGGITHTCYVLSNGNGVCYGLDVQHATDWVPGQPTAVLNYTGGGAIAVSASLTDTCFLLYNGSSVCYGTYHYSGNTYLPNYTAGNAIGVAVGGTHVCYLLQNGTTSCFGGYAYGAAVNYLGSNLAMPFQSNGTVQNFTNYSMSIANAGNLTSAQYTVSNLSNGAYAYYVQCTAQADNATKNITATNFITINVNLLGNLTVTVNGTGGSASGSNYTFFPPKNLTITAAPSYGYVFSGWGIQSGNCSISNPLLLSTNVSIPDVTPCTIQANFQPLIPTPIAVNYFNYSSPNVTGFVSSFDYSQGALQTATGNSDTFPLMILGTIFMAFYIIGSRYTQERAMTYATFMITVVAFFMVSANILDPKWLMLCIISFIVAVYLAKRL